MRLPLFLLLLVSPCLASPVLTFSGTGADALINFQLTYTDGLLSDPGLHAWFYLPPGHFNYCNLPGGDTCNQVLFTAGGGSLEVEATNLDVWTFEFPTSYIDNGFYTATGGGGTGTGTLTVTGSTDPAPEPRYGLLLVAVTLFFLARKRVAHRFA
jgi:hypothetical protein